VQKVNVREYAQKLTKPFLVARLAMVDNYLVSIYSCHGAMTWHRHLDEDELFIGYGGTATIETAWGAATLSFSDILRVPKGLPHRSVSIAPATLLMVQTRGLPARRNGYQRVYAGDEGTIKKISVEKETARLRDVYVPKRLTTTDTLGISVQICLGAQQWHAHEGDQLILCQHGQLLVEGEGVAAPAMRGEIVVVPGGERHRIVAAEPATAVGMARVAR